MEKNPFEKSTLFQVTGEPATDDAKKAALRTAVLRTIISISILIIIVVGLIFSIRYLPNVFGSFSSFFSKLFNSEKISLAVTPKKVLSGTPLTITPTHKTAATSTPGFYTFAYECVSDFNFYAQQSASSTTLIPCNKPLYTASTTPITFVPVITGTTTKVAVPFSYAYVLPGTTTPQTIGKVTITVTNTKVGSTNTAPTTTSQATTQYSTIEGQQQSSGATSYSRPNTPTDLEGTIFIRGIIDPRTGLFTPRSYVAPGERAAIRLQVMNTGGVASGQWNFSAKLPSVETPTYISTLQNPLQPGYSATYTISFIYEPAFNNGQVVVTLDPQNSVAEGNEKNNTISMRF